MTALHYRSATDVAAAIRDGALTSEELLDALLARVRDHDRRLNVVVAIDEEHARRCAREADTAVRDGRTLGPLHGVPMTIKDAYDTTHLPTTMGLPWLARNRPTRPAAAVERLETAGAFVFAKTSLPFASYDYQAIHFRRGRCRNPWDPERVPGGSSGGSAAALAAGFTPLEMGSDVAGSIRCPAHFCGVYGLRPTEGAISTAGHGHVPGAAPGLRSLVTCGPMARSLDDLALALDVVAGPTSPLTRHAEPHEDDGANDGAARPLRIAWSDSLGPYRADEATRGALRSLVDELDRAGHTVLRAEPQLDVERVFDTWARIQGFEMAVTLPSIFRMLGVPWTFRLGVAHFLFGAGPFSRGLGHGLTMSRQRYFRDLEERDEAMQAYASFAEHHDAWLTPVTATSAFTHRRTGAAIDVDDVPTPYGIANGAFLCPTAFYGHPVAVVPAGRSPDGMPIGIQIHGRHGEDRRLLALARRIDAASPVAGLWADADPLAG